MAHQGRLRPQGGSVKVTNLTNRVDYRKLNTFVLKGGDAFINEAGNILLVVSPNMAYCKTLSLQDYGAQFSDSFPVAITTDRYRRVEVEICITDPK